MARLSLAFLLALGCHVLLFFVVLGQGDNLPQVKGIRQVTVRLSHPTPERTREKAAPVEEVVEEITEPVLEESLISTPVAQLQPEKRKKVVPPEVIQKEKPVRETVKPIDIFSKEAKESMPVIESVTGADEVIEQELEAAVIYEAVPIYQSNQPPEYPGLARRRGWEGTVLVEVDVSEDGQARSVLVRTSSSHGLLDNAALEAVKKWRFRPGTKGGKPVAMRVLVPVHFVLKDMQ